MGVRDLPSLKQRNNTGQLLAAAWSRPPAERFRFCGVERPWRPTLTGWLPDHGSRGWRFPRLHPRLGGVIDRDRFGAGGGEPDTLWSKMSKKQKNIL
jgi:hypothetical protein